MSWSMVSQSKTLEDGCVNKPLSVPKLLSPIYIFQGHPSPKHCNPIYYGWWTVQPVPPAAFTRVHNVEPSCRTELAMTKPKLFPRQSIVMDVEKYLDA